MDEQGPARTWGKARSSVPVCDRPCKSVCPCSSHRKRPQARQRHQHERQQVRVDDVVDAGAHAVAVPQVEDLQRQREQEAGEQRLIGRQAAPEHDQRDQQAEEADVEGDGVLGQRQDGEPPELEELVGGLHRNPPAYSRRWLATGIAWRTRATRSRSISAKAMPGPSAAVATGTPQGSTIIACPQGWARPPSSCRPCCAGAITQHWVSMARARSSGSQWSLPVASVKAEGIITISAPSSTSRR